jgi:hypothetical protein
MEFHTPLVLFVLSAAAAGCQPDICADGVFGGSVIVLPDRLRIEGPPNEDFLFSDGPSPFEKCTEIFEISLAGGPSDDRFYPHLEKLSVIGPDALFNDADDGVIDVESIDGFDSVTSLGTIGGEVRTITGFNNVETAQSIVANGTHIEGLNALEEVGEITGFVGSVEGLANLKTLGTLKFTSAGMIDASLPALEDVRQDFTLQQTAISALSYPKLSHVGGNVLIELQSSLSDWGGFADSAHIDGDFTATSNAPVTNEDILGWIQRSAVVIGGATLVCGNGGTGIPDPTCP